MGVIQVHYLTHAELSLQMLLAVAYSAHIAFIAASDPRVYPSARAICFTIIRVTTVLAFIHTFHIISKVLGIDHSGASAHKNTILALYLKA
jgi:hypothetical protein